MRVTVPVRHEGRVVIPAAVRDHLELEYGDLVEIEVGRPSEASE
jgi:AbrB family looped-hinge helix DNA binding protein